MTYGDRHPYKATLVFTLAVGLLFLAFPWLVIAANEFVEIYNTYCNWAVGSFK